MVLAMDSHELEDLGDAEYSRMITLCVFSLLCLFFNEMSCKKVPNIYCQLSGESSGYSFLIVHRFVLLRLTRNLFLKRVT